VIAYQDVRHPHTGQPALNPHTGEILGEGGLSSGEQWFAVIARKIVKLGRPLDESLQEALVRLVERDDAVCYADVCHPYGKRPALDPVTGEIFCEGTLSSGEYAFAVIAKSIVDGGWHMDATLTQEVIRLLRAC
jgi:hypothetical protein